MALTKVSASKMKLNAGLDLSFTTMSDTTNGVAIDASGKDFKTVLIFKGAGTVTLKAGDLIQGVKDEVITTIANGTAVVVDSGRFKARKVTDGTNTFEQCIQAIPSANTISVAVVQLPDEGDLLVPETM